MILTIQLIIPVANQRIFHDNSALNAIPGSFLKISSIKRESVGKVVVYFNDVATRFIFLCNSEIKTVHHGGRIPGQSWPNDRKNTDTSANTRGTGNRRKIRSSLGLVLLQRKHLDQHGDVALLLMQLRI